MWSRFSVDGKKSVNVLWVASKKNTDGPVILQSGQGFGKQFKWEADRGSEITAVVSHTQLSSRARGYLFSRCFQGPLTKSIIVGPGNGRKGRG